MSNALPECLYHYASVPTLALILQTRTIRFTRLDLVNDPEDGSPIDLPVAQSFVFVSCWMGDSRESIPMWSMYGGGVRGCRIGLPPGWIDGEPVADAARPSTRLRKELSCKRDDKDFECPIGTVVGPEPVSYSDEEAKVHPSVMLPPRDGSVALDVSGLGLTKRTPWAYENEWRYRITEAIAGETTPYPTPTDDVDFRYLYWAGMVTRSIDVSISAKSYEAMTITRGPRMTPGDRVIVDALVGRFNPSATVRDSDVQIRR